MKKIFIISILLIMQGCTNEDDAGKEISGSWLSVCSTEFLSVNSTPIQTIPFKTKLTYINNSVFVYINTYSDNDCLSLISSDSAEDTGLLALSTLPVTYEIGNQITTSNGVVVKELNNYNHLEELVPDIFLIENNGTTLYLGQKCIPQLNGPNFTCPTDRPTELDYIRYFTKI